MARNVRISDNLDDYEYIESEGIYLLRLHEQLEPRTFIYLVQVELLHNDGRVKGSGGMVVDGLAESTDLITGQPSSEPVSHYFGTLFQEQPQDDGTLRTFIGGRMVTFGKAKEPNYVYVLLSYSNGSSRWVRVDITDQIDRQPKGGVINIVLDINDYEPLTPTDPSQGGGFNVDVGGWNEDNHHVKI